MIVNYNTFLMINCQNILCSVYKIISRISIIDFVLVLSSAEMLSIPEWSVTESCGMMHEYGRDVRVRIFKRKGLISNRKSVSRNYPHRLIKKLDYKSK